MEEPLTRCPWCTGDPLYTAYHDQEWGNPVHDDRIFFEYLLLEGAQAGLSWFTILKRRENYRLAFAGFDPREVALFTEDDQARLLANAGIIRNRAKIRSAIENARLFLNVQQEFGSFDRYIWGFMPDSKPLPGDFSDFSQVPVTTPVSDAMSRDLKKRGFSFMGSVICYAFMQATGLVNDHLSSCYRNTPVREL